MRTSKKILAMAGAAAGIATAITPSAALAQPADTASNEVALSALRTNIVNWANNEWADNSHNREIPGEANCNYYSGVLESGSDNCTGNYRRERWCASFAKFVWKNAGAADTGRLDARTESFQEYGNRHGTKRGGLGGIQPGDAVLYADPTPGMTSHVGIVVGVNGSQVSVVSGNVNDRVYKHDVHYLQAEAVAYVSPVA